MPEEDEEVRDPTEVVRLVILGLGLALNLWVMWDMYRDHPEVIALRHRWRSWWEANVEGPRKRAKAIRRAEAETVFEALQIVEEKT